MTDLSERCSRTHIALLCDEQPKSSMMAHVDIDDVKKISRICRTMIDGSAVRVRVELFTVLNRRRRRSMNN
jgi:hypothetical protein